FSWVLIARGNENFLSDLLVNRGDVVAARAVVEDSDYGRMGAVQSAKNTAFGAAVGFDRADFHQHAVAVHGSADGGRRNKDVACESRAQCFIRRPRFGNDKAEAIA